MHSFNSIHIDKNKRTLQIIIFCSLVFYTCGKPNPSEKNDMIEMIKKGCNNVENITNYKEFVSQEVIHQCRSFQNVSLSEEVTGLDDMRNYVCSLYLQSFTLYCNKFSDNYIVNDILKLPADKLCKELATSIIKFAALTNPDEFQKNCKSLCVDFDDHLQSPCIAAYKFTNRLVTAPKSEDVQKHQLVTNPTSTDVLQNNQSRDNTIPSVVKPDIATQNTEQNVVDKKSTGIVELDTVSKQNDVQEQQNVPHELQNNLPNNANQPEASESKTIKQNSEGKISTTETLNSPSLPDTADKADVGKGKQTSDVHSVDQTQQLTNANPSKTNIEAETAANDESHNSVKNPNSEVRDEANTGRNTDLSKKIGKVADKPPKVEEEVSGKKQTNSKTSDNINETSDPKVDAEIQDKQETKPYQESGQPEQTNDIPIDELSTDEKITATGDKPTMQDQDDDFGLEKDENEEIIKKTEEVEANNAYEGSPHLGRDDYSDDMNGDSNFFSYFMAISALFVLGYVVYHNKQKVIALVLEGRQAKRPHRGRRPNSASYHKLDSNLEEAISSSCHKNSSNIIY